MAYKKIVTVWILRLGLTHVRPALGILLARHKMTLKGLRSLLRFQSRRLLVWNKIKDRWCNEVRGKFEYTVAIPHKVAGGFGEYFGYALAQAKKCVQ